MIIKDKAIEPYMIEVNTNSFNVGKIAPVKDKEGNVKDIFQADTFHNSLENAVLRVDTIKTLEGSDYMTLKQYCESISKIRDSIKESVSR